MTRQGAATVEQDTVEDVTQCVYAVLATEIGERQEEPEYGVVDMAFLQGGADLEEIQTAVTEWEPRARLLSEDSWDGLVQTVTERVSVAND
jgi:phage baseplate assembly protein W